MGCWRRKNTAGAMFALPGPGFWIFYGVSGLLIFMWGMRYAIRRAAVPIVGYRLLKLLFRR